MSLKNKVQVLVATLVLIFANVVQADDKHDVVSDQAPDVMADLSASTAKDAGIKCPRYKIFYIDPTAQFFTPPVPLEDYAEFVFCSDHANLDEIRAKLKKMKPVRSQVDAGAGRIKVVPRGRADDAITFCSTGEITYRGKQYRLDRRLYEPSLVSIREEGDRQRAMAIETEDDRNPASESKRAKAMKPKTGSVTPTNPSSTPVSGPAPETPPPATK